MAEETKNSNLTEANDATRAPVWQAAFLTTLADMGNVTAACKAADVSRPVVYDRKNSNPEFAALWEEALDTASDSLEQEAIRRARDGYDRPIFQGGDKVGVVREYSDNLLITLLKAHRPQKYRENTKVEVSGSIDFNKIRERGNELAKQERQAPEAALGRA